MDVQLHKEVRHAFEDSWVVMHGKDFQLASESYALYEGEDSHAFTLHHLIGLYWVVEYPDKCELRRDVGDQQTMSLQKVDDFTLFNDVICSPQLQDSTRLVCNTAENPKRWSFGTKILSTLDDITSQNGPFKPKWMRHKLGVLASPVDDPYSLENYTVPIEGGMGGWIEDGVPR